MCDAKPICGLLLRQALDEDSADGFVSPLQGVGWILKELIAACVVHDLLAPECYLLSDANQMLKHEAKYREVKKPRHTRPPSRSRFVATVFTCPASITRRVTLKFKNTGKKAACHPQNVTNWASRKSAFKARQHKVFSNTLSGNEEDVPALSSSAISERTLICQIVLEIRKT